MNENQKLMALDADEHITRLKSGLSEVREQARVQQNTLDDILQLLQRLLITEPERPRNPNQIPGAPATTPRILTLRTPVLDSSPHVRAHGLKLATPNEFDGDRLKGQAFLNLCRLYIALCKDQFRDEQTQIHWVLSFMKSRCAALYANQILQKEASEDLPFFLSWQEFNRDFSSKFCPKNEATVALTKLKSSRYYQG